MAAPLFAVSYLVPSDREMIQRSDDIVVATAVTSAVERTPEGGIVTRYYLRIEDVLKGERTRGSYLRLTEIGGSLADLTLEVSGMPVYVPGRRYLVFTNTNRDGEPETWGLELGQFALEKDGEGRPMALRNTGLAFDANNFESYSEKTRDARGFMDYIRGIVAQNIDPTPAYFFDPAPAKKLHENDIHAQVFTRASYLVTGAPRWQSTPNASVRTASAPSGGINGVNPVTSAIGTWNSTAGNIAYSYFGQDDTATAGFTSHDSKNAVLYGDPNSEVAPPVLARGGYWTSNAPYSFGGENFKAIDGGIDVVVDNFSFTQCLLNVVILHEMGHTFGFRHSNQNGDNSLPCNTSLNDCTGSAVMNSSVGCSLTTLQTWDQNAVAVVYGTGPQCTTVSISGQPQNKTITQGQPANVTVTAAGSSPFTYQWYIGNPSDTSTLLAGQTTATLTHAPTTTTTYWVRVGGCNSSTADSAAVTVTVQAPTCTPPSIATQPTGTTITQGQSAQLSVGAAGTGPLSYQWFAGGTGDTSQFAGSGNPVTLSPSTTTRYWVRVTGQCAPVADSTPVTITVTTASCPDVTVGAPQATQLQSGQYSLDVTASSGGRPLTYQWFQGPLPGSGNSVGNTKQIVVPAPTVPTSYSVIARNDCGKEAASVVITINPCSDIPVITTEPLDAAIATGASATLTVAFTSTTTATVTWYRGAAPNKTNQAGTGATLNTGALTATTQFWASIINGCGEKTSRTVTITVGTACTQPSIVSQSNGTTKFKGETVTLTVAATGTETLHYEWYDGVSGDQSRPVGTDSNSFTSAVLTNPKLFWVKVRNTCGSANSNTIVIDVKPPKYRSVRH
ncbi:MAG: hypothetical protein DMF56_01815 [Acidobacteria bacterium]|nr:MAG: hypothetical protein DMF56_01815 [Acidobacteriota bacterium]